MVERLRGMKNIYGRGAAEEEKLERSSVTDIESFHPEKKRKVGACI